MKACRNYRALAEVHSTSRRTTETQKLRPHYLIRDLTVTRDTKMLPPTSSSLRHSWLVLKQTRCISSSPYGRTHVWKRRLPTLPNPVVPKFPQHVVRADGTSFTHWTTSPRSVIRLTRDVTNNPMWNTGMWTDERAVEEEASRSGRLGRFNRRFGGEDGEGVKVDWGKGAEEVGVYEGEIVNASDYARKSVKKGKGRK